MTATDNLELGMIHSKDLESKENEIKQEMETRIGEVETENAALKEEVSRLNAKAD